MSPGTTRRPSDDATASRAPAALIPFTKMHGIGNDYLFVDCLGRTIEDPVGLARAMSDPHVGVGADGLILVMPPANAAGADLRMRIFNRDGSEAEMCGNGIRCVCKFAYERRLATTRPMRIETGAGVRFVEYEVDEGGLVHEATVDMGVPSFDLADLPADPARLRGVGPTYEIAVGGEPLEAVLISTGNPHMVVFVPDVASIPLETVGPACEGHAAFPRRINAHFVEVHAAGEVTMRTWERGSGATLACGTGAAAVCAAGMVTERTGRSLLAHLPGGDLMLAWDEGTGRITKTGPAVEIFSGTWPVAGLEAGM